MSDRCSIMLVYDPVHGKQIEEALGVEVFDFGGVSTLHNGEFSDFDILDDLTKEGIDFIGCHSAGDNYNAMALVSCKGVLVQWEIYGGRLVGFLDERGKVENPRRVSRRVREFVKLWRMVAERLGVTKEHPIWVEPC